MKGQIYAGSLALLLAIAPSTMGIANAEPLTVDKLNQSSAIQGSNTFEFNAPIVASSGVLGTNHFIRIAVIGMSLEDVMIALPSQMERYSSIELKDQTGKVIPAKITKTPNRVTLTFDKPLAPGNTLQVLFTGVEMRQTGGDTLLYGVTAERVGTTGEIPVGTARIQVPTRGS